MSFSEGHLWSILQDYDCDSSKGCQIYPVRTNLLINVKQYTMTDIELGFLFDQHIPEGFGLHAFAHDFLTVPGDELCSTDLCMIWDAASSMPPKGCKIWLLQVWQDDCDVTKFHFDMDSTWCFADSPDRDFSTTHHLELFSGGVGGWTTAFRFLSDFTHHPVVSVGIDYHADIAKTFALNQQAAFVIPRVELPEDAFAFHDENWVVCDDVRSNHWMRLVTKWGVDVVTISSPCGPWSTASTGLGLEREDGALILHGILKCRFFRPTYIAIENVPGFASHAHKVHVERAIRWIGYRMQWQRIIDAKAVMGITRSRWLAVAVRVHSHVNTAPFPPWVFPQDHKIDHAQFLLPWNQKTLDALAITDEICRVASDPRKAGRTILAKSPEQVMQQRLYDTNMILPPFMARYGSQHELSDTHLNDHSYYGFFLAQPQLKHGGRLFHPAEIGLLHGAFDWMFVDDDLHHSWLVMGNSILPFHALIPLTHVINAFLPTKILPNQVLDQFIKYRLSTSTTQVTSMNGGALYTNEDHMPDGPFLESAQSLAGFVHAMDPLAVWLPWVGVSSLKQCTGMSKQPQPEVSQPASVISVPSSIEPTVPFAVVLQAVITADAFEQRFWYSSDLPAQSIRAPWNHVFECVFPKDMETTTMLHLPADNTTHAHENNSRDLAQILVDQQLTLYKCDPKIPLLSHDDVADMGKDLYDQFGLLTNAQMPEDSVLVTTQAITHQVYQGDILRLLAVLDLITTQISWDYNLDAMVLHLHGESQCTEVVANFWMQVMTHETEQLFGRSCEKTVYASGIMLQFLPQRTHGVIPPKAFDIAMSVLAFRSLLSPVLKAYEGPYTHKVLIKWLCRPLWAEALPKEITAGIIIKLLHFALQPTNGVTEHRLVHLSKQVMPAIEIGTLDKQASRDAIVIHVVMRLQGGGGNTGAKHQNRMMQQSALASYLLEQGYELSWVTSTVDTLCNRFGLAKLQHVTAMPVGSQKMTALLALLKEASIAVPALPTPQTRKQAQGMPWQKPKKHKGDSMIDPSEYSFIPGFFQNQDTSPCAQLDTIRPQATGVAIASPAQSATWLTAQEKISSDELALLIVGKPPATTMQGVEITVPCHNRDGQMVLLHCHLFQLGTKDVTFQQGDPHMVMADKCALVALTLYKTDFTGEHWTDALQRTVPFIRQILDKEGLGEHVLSIWGRSFRNERAACSPLQALTLQVHCSVLEDKLPKLLAKSGFNKLYCTPKTADGRLDTTYRVLWLADSGQAAVYSAKVANSLGLVKGKKTLGLRFRASDFDSAWAVLCPGQPMPGQKAGELVFRVDGLPFGVTTTMIDTWAQKIKWNCQAVRALGPQAMLVRSDEQPPPGVVMFNTQAVLIRHLPPRTRQNAPLMVGPRSAKPKYATKDHNPDPWAAWQGPRLQAPPGPAAGNRSIDGPTETRLAAQDQKLQHIEKATPDTCSQQ